jgi:hypothetical protein
MADNKPNPKKKGQDLTIHDILRMRELDTMPPTDDTPVEKKEDVKAEVQEESQSQISEAPVDGSAVTEKDAADPEPEGKKEELKGDDAFTEQREDIEKEIEEANERTSLFKCLEAYEQEYLNRTRKFTTRCVLIDTRVMDTIDLLNVNNMGKGNLVSAMLVWCIEKNKEELKKYLKQRDTLL